MASIEEVLQEFERQRNFENRRTPGGQVHIYQLGHTKAPMCTTTITGKTWPTDEEPTCERCIAAWEEAARIYIATRVKRWWENPPSWTNRHLEKAEKSKSKHKQGGFDLVVEEPATYHKKKKVENHES